MDSCTSPRHADRGRRSRYGLPVGGPQWQLSLCGAGTLVAALPKTRLVMKRRRRVEGEDATDGGVNEERRRRMEEQGGAGGERSPWDVVPPRSLCPCRELQRGVVGARRLTARPLHTPLTRRWMWKPCPQFVLG
ncbi:unnamed protein product [Lampetra planeri]